MHEFEENDVDGGLESGQALDRAHSRRRGLPGARWVAPTNKTGRFLAFAGFVDALGPTAEVVITLDQVFVGKGPEKIQCVHDGQTARYACIALPVGYAVPEQFIVSGVEYVFLAYAMDLEVRGTLLAYIAHLLPSPTHKKAVTVELT